MCTHQVSVFTAARPDGTVLSGKGELIFDKLTDKRLRRFLMELGGTYTSKISPVLVAEVSVSMATASMYRELWQIFPIDQKLPVSCPTVIVPAEPADCGSSSL